MTRSSGILLHISSLPSPYGIGNLGKEARKFIDFLHASGQRYWQLLPISPTGYGDSPYQSASTFAGNPYFIDPDALLEQGLLTADELAGDWGDPNYVDYGLLYNRRHALLRKAYDRADHADPAFADFCRAEAGWLDDYALFMAVKQFHGNKPWPQWSRDLRLREPAALEAARQDLADEICYLKWVQYLFYTQWEALRAYAKAKNIRIIGDIPIYVPLDSADVWSAPDDFQLDPGRMPKVVAGCPPDGFSADGQYWGNPIYDWEKMEEDGFAWWIRRLAAAGRFFDVVRIDHFRGIESYWNIPAEEKTAVNGKWVKGPGIRFINAIKKALPQVEFIAEDLGFLTPEVRQMVEDSGFPGMKVLEFAFDPREPDNSYLPHLYNANCICYIGTHDNHTLAQWYEESAEADLEFAREYMGITEEDDFCHAMMRLGMDSAARLFVAQMQDWLGLGGEARMNEPGAVNNQNWRWRMLPGAATPDLAAKIFTLTEEFGRI
jgi:4-alpha-glucanotransferase